MENQSKGVMGVNPEIVWDEDFYTLLKQLEDEPDSIGDELDAVQYTGIHNGLLHIGLEGFKDAIENITDDQVCLFSDWFESFIQVHNEELSHLIDCRRQELDSDNLPEEEIVNRFELVEKEIDDWHKDRMFFYSISNIMEKRLYMTNIKYAAENSLQRFYHMQHLKEQEQRNAEVANLPDWFIKDITKVVQEVGKTVKQFEELIKLHKEVNQASQK